MKSAIQWAFAALFLVAAAMTPAPTAAGAAPAPVQIPAAASDAEAAAADAASDTPSADPVTAEGVPGDGPVGDWLGRLDVGPAVLRLGLEVTRGEDGSLAATLDSIDQGAVIPVDRARFAGSTLNLEIDAIGGSFRGELNTDGSALVGTWTQGGSSRDLTFLRQAEAYSLNRPQEPEEPFPYGTREVTFPGGDAGVELAGTLAVPAGEGPFPAVVFASGSGPQDRDESLMGHRPFLVIADHLARHGVASLRYDDRGFGESTGDHFASTVDDFADDLAAALAVLRGQPEVDGSRVGILGHSEGGLSAAKVAAADGPADFLVLLAPPGVPLTELLQRQAGDIYRQGGVDAALVERALRRQGESLALLRQDLPRDELRRRLRARAEEWVASLSDEEKAAMGVTEQTVDQSVRQSTTDWFLSLLREDPAHHLRRVEVPVLALFGGKDIQVDAESNAEAVRRALDAGDDPRHEVRVLDGLNHLFQSAETGAVAEYGSIEETISPEVLETVTTWIGERAGESDGSAD